MPVAGGKARCGSMGITEKDINLAQACRHSVGKGSAWEHCHSRDSYKLGARMRHGNMDIIKTVINLAQECIIEGGEAWHGSMTIADTDISLAQKSGYSGKNSAWEHDRSRNRYKLSVRMRLSQGKGSAWEHGLSRTERDLVQVCGHGVKRLGDGLWS